MFQHIASKEHQAMHAQTSPALWS